MGTLLLARHGQTDWNRENRILGRTDLPLNETGFLQARELAAYLANTKIDAIYSSPMRRTLQTAAPTAEGHGLAILKEDALIEQCFGIYEGADRFDPAYLREKNQHFMRYTGGGESFLDLAARVYPFLSRIAEKHAGGTILVVTHGGICRVIASFFTDLDNDEFVTYQAKNGEVKEFTF